MIARSEKALDGFNFFVADVRDGIGPYLTLFLISRPGWSPAHIGWALSTSGFVSLVMSAPAGYLYDLTQRRRAWLAGAALAIGLSTVALGFTSGFWTVLALQAATGVASAFIGPGIVAVSWQLVGRAGLSKRIARNETFNHSGNFVAALVASYLVGQFSVYAVFYLIVLMSLVAVFALGRLPHTPSKLTQAREKVFVSESGAPESVWRFVRNPTFLLFLLAAWSFQLANAAMLPIAAQLASARAPLDGVHLLSYGIVIAQLVAIPTAWASGYVARRFSPFLGMALGLGAIIARASVFAVATDVRALLAAQVFDGVAAGVMAVAPILIVFRITERRGRVTLSAGLLAATIGLGASASNVFAGYVLENFGGTCDFIVMAGVAGAALFLTGVTSLRVGLGEGRALHGG